MKRMEFNLHQTSINSQSARHYFRVMKRSTPRSSLVVVLVAGSLLSFGFSPTVHAEAKTSWKVSGELEEACSCRAPCPCWFKSLPSRMTCDGAQVIFINKGHYGKTSLDGLAVAQFVQSPEGKSMFESFGNWNIDYVYIDDRANAEQREALKALAAHFFPPGGKERKFRTAPITRKVEGTEHAITVGEYGSFSGHLIEGGYGDAPKISNPPLADPTHKEFLQGESTKMTYHDAGQGWDYEDSNYMWNKFQVDNKVYTKFEADMAKKMAQLKEKAEK
jgi:hypothetical protein